MQKQVMTLAVLLLAGHLNEEQLSGAKAGAQPTWASGIASFLTDKHFFRVLPKREISKRFGLLVPDPKVSSNIGFATGSNREAGILSMDANFTNRANSDDVYLEDVTFVMPLRDAANHAVYDELKASLSAQLTEPQWHHKLVNKFDFWRKGTSRQMVYIAIDNHSFDPAVVSSPGPGPYVIAVGGTEQGDSDEP